MAELPALVKDLALILVVAGVVTLLFKRLRQPLVLGYIVAGYLVSPHMPYTLSVMDTSNVKTWADLNVAHQEIDLKNPQTNRRNAGFTDEERGKMSVLLDSGFVDTFRLLHPTEEGAYSWWSYRFRAREKNVGWRIDYFIVSQRLAPQVAEAAIHAEVMGSDHCPVELRLAE